MSKYQELIKRLEDGEGGDRELDADILRALCNFPNDPPPRVIWMDERACRVTDWAMRPTSDLQHCLSLQEAVLPGWHWNMSIDDGIADAEVFHRDGTGMIDDAYHGAHAETCRAWLIAILRALEAQETDQ